MSTRNINLPNSLNNKIDELAKKEEISVDQFIITAVAEKMSALMAKEYLEEKGRRASRQKYERALDQVPDVEPEKYDKIN